MVTVGLDPYLKKHVSKYSLGMKQRLGIAQAIMEDPKLLLLDEPMNGLDNEGVEYIRNLLISLKEKGKLLFWQAIIWMILIYFVIPYARWIKEKSKRLNKYKRI